MGQRGAGAIFKLRADERVQTSLPVSVEADLTCFTPRIGFKWACGLPSLQYLLDPLNERGPLLFV
jgi:hypothetical protein